MRFLSVMLLLPALSGAFGQSVMDGSDRKLSPRQRKQLRASVDVLSTDPYRVELRHLHMGAGGVFCGEMNGTNMYGGRNGFGRFYIDAEKRDGLIDVPSMPEMRPSVLPRIAALCGG